MRRAVWRMPLIVWCMSGGLDARSTCGQEKQSESPAVASQVALSVDGEVERPLRLSAAELATLPRHTARVIDHGGQEATFAGPPLVEILRLAGGK
jgi:DMSO/TMAO reductase YedYZ molybdopterin-dependent catalytic subunit